MFKSEPKPPIITLCDIPHGIHGLKQGNPCPNSKIKSQSIPNNMTQSKEDPTEPPNIPMTYSMSIPDSKSPNITLGKSPHEIHCPKQGNKCPNPKRKSQYSPDETTHSYMDHQKTPPLPLTPPNSKCDPKPPSITPNERPHGSHGPKQGKPYPNP